MAVLQGSYLQNMCMFVYMCMCLCLCVCMNVRVLGVHVCMYAFMCMCVYMCMYIDMVYFVTTILEISTSRENKDR